MKTYLVGGAIRDRLLGRRVSERDFVVVGATAEELLSQGYTQVGRDFPVFLHPETREEYALARTERKTAPGYQGFVVHAAPDITLEQDLERRDLTINALAEDEEGHLVDPWNGRSDLENRVLRHVSPAFMEDPVRVLRVARFAARYADLNFTIADETQTLMKQMVTQGEVDALVPERVWQELAKALHETKPSLFFRVLERCGALERLFPEIHCLTRNPGNGLESALAALDAATPLTESREVRFSALNHSLDDTSIETLCTRLKCPNRFCILARLLASHYDLVPDTESLNPNSALRILESTDALRRPQRFEQFLLGCEAIYRAKPPARGDNPPASRLLLQMLDELRRIDIGALVKGEKDTGVIQQRIRQERLSRLVSFLGGCRT
ncbi:MAG: multifunctional CCA addition/repair protein [Gammaproteobacteria bacterium]|nr:multifunctional CCA addition/repair protein [Gammaproteobacteria bacterium]